MRLYASQNACSISPHITLRELGIPFEIERVDLRTKVTGTGANFLTINPRGYVPALRLDDGAVLTEGAILVQYLADLHPERKLAPPLGTPARWRLMELMHFTATELHKAMSPFYNPKASDEFKASLHERMALRWAQYERMVGEGPFALGEQFSVLDPYAFYVMRAWQNSVKASLSAWPRLVAYYERMSARLTVQAALKAEDALGNDVVLVG
jgi:glutathione S-transferase